MLASLLLQRPHLIMMLKSMDGVYLKRFNKWNQCRIANFSIHSESACNYNIESIGSRRFLSPYFLLDRERTYNVLLSSLTGQNVKNRSPSAIEIKDLNINWHSLFKPVIDVNASGIVLNVVTRKDPLHIGHSTIGLTIPMTTVGGWGIDELIDMKPPPPPDEEGLYPRMGTINLTDARILSHVVKDDVVTVNEIKIPDAFFYPLFQLTQLAGINGTDQKVVEEVIKRSILMVIEKQVLNDDELLSKTMKTFLESVQKSSEFVHEMNQFIQQKVQEWSGSIEDNVFKADKALNRYLEKIETDWSTILNDDKNPFVKFSKDMKEVGQKIIDDAEIKLNTVILDEKSNMGPLLTKELKEAWNVVKKPLTEFESEINNFDQVFDKVKNEVMDGFMNAKQKFSNFMDDTRMKKRV